jgi:hypothetical protein
VNLYRVHFGSTSKCVWAGDEEEAIANAVSNGYGSEDDVVYVEEA